MKKTHKFSTQMTVMKFYLSPGRMHFDEALSHPLKHNETLCTPEKLSHSQLASTHFAFYYVLHILRNVYLTGCGIQYTVYTYTEYTSKSSFMYLEVIA